MHRPLTAALALLTTCGPPVEEPTPPPGCVWAEADVPLCPWPAEAPEDAVNLTAAEGDAPNDFYVNLSAASWNEASQTLWVARNGPGDASKIWALEEDGAGGFQIIEEDGHRAEWTHFGDLEGLTQVSGGDPWEVLIIVEDTGEIQRWDLTDFTDDHPRGGWDISGWLPADAPSGDGPEALVFIPDAQLTAAGFVDGSGAAATSQGGMGGLVLVGHQYGGQVYAFDLDVGGDDARLVGIYDTAATETAALELDPTTGLLYMWHGADARLLEVARLSSSPNGDGRRLDTVSLYGPPEGTGADRNWEGLAITPSSSCVGGHRSLFLTEDDGEDRSLLWFKGFPCE